MFNELVFLSSIPVYYVKKNNNKIKWLCQQPQMHVYSANVKYTYPEMNLFN